MEVRGPPVDRLTLSNLPSSIIRTILTRMPMRDAFRTCILSRNWKDHCVNIPRLFFDDELFQGPAYRTLSIKCKLLHIIYPVLLLHRGPILTFTLCISRLNSCCEIDQIILHLSRTATVENFTLSIAIGHGHKLLSSFFMLQQLVVLFLHNCAFQPPATFEGFSRLTTLYLVNVSITAEVLLRFISNSPLLIDLMLFGDEKHFLGCWDSDLVELCEHLPILDRLQMSSYPIQCFATGVTPQKTLALLNRLAYLRLSELCFKENELRSVLYLLASSPNLKTLKLAMCHDPIELKFVPHDAMSFFDLQDYSYLILNHLREIKIKNFTNRKPLMDFVKLILVKSPTLKLATIVIDERVSVGDEVKMLKEMIQYQRASAGAKINFKRAELFV